MAEGSVAVAVPPAAPPCRLGGAGAAPAPARGRQCCCGIGSEGCGIRLARLVRRLRRRGRRALRAAATQPRGLACQYDPLSYARNFDFGGTGDAFDDADAARVYYSCSFSSRFVLVPTATASSSAVAGAGAVSAGAAPAVATS
ncbi:hypothetical protein BAE44_0016585 [Dichanthelium oligosanthes]|uniref:Uncharacterized protein n=1 Tax=Dichanthelium oligosanthes TaxID=888268 RepID=A0A1E5VBF5_9POAL|nr:hypothetical protein BAE44_0016585 [Dichanthelium oligosanthes]